MIVVSMPQQGPLVVNNHKWIKCMAAELANHKPANQQNCNSFMLDHDRSIRLYKDFHFSTLSLYFISTLKNENSQRHTTPLLQNQETLTTMEDPGEQIVTEVDDTKVGDRYYV